MLRTAPLVVILPPNAFAKDPAPPPGVPFKVRGPATVRGAVVLIPWLAPVGPPIPVRLRVLDVTAAQALVIETPWAPARVAVLVPFKVIEPEVLVMEFVEAERIPTLAAEPDAVPVKDIVPEAN